MSSTLPTRSPLSTRGSLASPEFLDAAFFGGIMIIVTLGDQLRILGGAFFLIALVMMCASSRVSITKRDQIWMAVFCAVTILYIIFSFLHVLPHGWTVYYETGAILNQSVSVLSFVFVITASQRWWTRLSAGLISNRRLILLTLASVFLGFLADAFIGGKGWNFLRISATLRNGTSIYILILAFFATRGSLRAWFFLITSAALTLVAGGYLQTALIYLITIGLMSLNIVRMQWGRTLIKFYIVALIIATTYGLFHIYQIWRLDFNTGWRLQFWRDVLESTVLTNGLGVGFGTEALKNFYPDLANRVFSEPNEQFILIGTHSGFMDTLLRMGILGLIPLIMIFWTSFPRVSKTSRATNLCAVAFVLALTCTFSDVALQSPLYMVGIAFCLGFIRAQNKLFPSHPTVTQSPSTGFSDSKLEYAR